jgi:hypothetical protein
MRQIGRFRTGTIPLRENSRILSEEPAKRGLCPPLAEFNRQADSTRLLLGGKTWTIATDMLLGAAGIRFDQYAGPEPGVGFGGNSMKISS